MVNLLTTVNYKGEIIGPGIAYLDHEYEKLLVANGNATFDINKNEKEEYQDDKHQEYEQQEEHKDDKQEDTNDKKEEKPKTRRKSSEVK